MNFDEFWGLLLTDLNHEKKFTTLSRESEFNAYSEHNTNDEWVVRVITNNGELRGQIPSNEFEVVWNNAKDRPLDKRFVNNDGKLESYITKSGSEGKTMNLSYITKLIHYVVNDQNMT